MPDTADMDPDEAAAWAELRAAFGEEEECDQNAEEPPAKKAAAEPAAPGVGKAAKGKGKGKAKGVLAQELSASGRKAVIDDEKLTQAQVDRFVGQITRLAGGPFPPSMLGGLWSLPMEVQLDLLRGVSGADGSDISEEVQNETQTEKSRRMWRTLEETIRKKGGKMGAPKLQQAAAPAKKRPPPKR